MHDDDGKPAWMSAQGRRCEGSCGGWRDPATFGTTARAFHLQVTAVEPAIGGVSRVHGYWCAGGFDPNEPLAMVDSGGDVVPVEIISIESPPSPGWASRPHLRWFSVRSPGRAVDVGSCIRAAADLNATSV